MKLMFVSLNVYWTLRSCGLATFPLGPDLVIRDSQPPKKNPRGFLVAVHQCSGQHFQQHGLEADFFRKNTGIWEKKRRNLTLRIRWKTPLNMELWIPWMFGRLCSFLNGRFVCSMLIFQGVCPKEGSSLNQYYDLGMGCFDHQSYENREFGFLV